MCRIDECDTQLKEHESQLKVGANVPASVHRFQSSSLIGISRSDDLCCFIAQPFRQH
jgi:hypothetical protein